MKTYEPRSRYFRRRAPARDRIGSHVASKYIRDSGLGHVALHPDATRARAESSSYHKPDSPPQLCSRPARDGTFGLHEAAICVRCLAQPPPLFGSILELAFALPPSYVRKLVDWVGRPQALQQQQQQLPLSCGRERGASVAGREGKVPSSLALHQVSACDSLPQH